MEQIENSLPILELNKSCKTWQCGLSTQHVEFWTEFWKFLDSFCRILECFILKKLTSMQKTNKKRESIEFYTHKCRILDIFYNSSTILCFRIIPVLHKGSNWFGHGSWIRAQDEVGLTLFLLGCHSIWAWTWLFVFWYQLRLPIPWMSFS